MDFSSNQHEYHRPITLINPTNTTYETSSSSLATITSGRSSASLEFNDDSKPSGVLVDDDFLPMSSPVDDHFWDMTNPNFFAKFSSNKQQINTNECFPNVGSSPDIEVKHFPLVTSTNDQPLSETSCDEDDDDDQRQTYSVHEYQLKELQKPIVIHHRSVLNPSVQSNETTPVNDDLSLANLCTCHLKIDEERKKKLIICFLF